MTPTVNKIVGAIGVGALATVSALTAGLVPAIVTGVGAAALWFVGLWHPSPGSTVPAPVEPPK